MEELLEIDLNDTDGFKICKMLIKNFNEKKSS